MRTITLIGAVAVLTLIGCRKKADEASASSYHATTINGLHDLTIKTIDDINVPITITSSNKNQYITLNVTGMPNYLLATFNPAIGIPNFASYLNLKSLRVEPGAYTLKLKASTESGIEDSFDLHIKIISDQQCVDKVVGNYNGVFDCSKSGIFGSNIASIQKIDDYTVSIKNLNIGPNNVLDSVIVAVDCNASSLSIPDQMEKHSYHIMSGQGEILPEKLEILYTVELAETCKASLTKR